MDFFSTYSESDGEDARQASPGDSAEETAAAVSLKRKSAAPQVDTKGLAIIDASVAPAAQELWLSDARARSVKYNLPMSEMHAPVLGPTHPLAKEGIATRNHKSGHVEDYNVHSFVFDEQHRTYDSYGYAIAPGGQQVVGSKEGFTNYLGETVYSTATKRQKTEKRKQPPPAAADEPWSLHERQPWADKEVTPAVLNEEQKAYLEKVAKEKEQAEAEEAPTDKTRFHGKAEKDAMGRSWMDAPKDKKKESDNCFLPKRWIHTWAGHTKGVNAIRFFPNTGHLLLSAGMDGKIKIWDVYGSGKCMRTYMGFTKGVKDINFSNDGRRFLSTSYDKGIKLWDTETGQVISSYGEKKMFYVAKFHPEQQNVMLAGCGDKKIYQWDMDSGDLVQVRTATFSTGAQENYAAVANDKRFAVPYEYDYHLAAVNTITFVDEGRRFVSTSDDKTIRVWDLGVPVQIKYMADPAMHSMPAVTLSPDKKWFIGTSLDNQILTYSTKDKFRQNRKKTFKGHTVAGYACRPSFSPDGRYVLSGDGGGRLLFWEWRDTKIVRTFKAHDAVCIDAAWHPLESSKVATASWDGAIKYWD